MDARLLLAFQHHRAGRLAEAEPIYAQLSADQPDRAAVWHGWGLLAAQQRDLSTAAARVEKAVALSPHEATFWNTLGRVRSERREPALAAAAYGRVVDLDPAARAAWASLIVELRRAGAVEQAIAAGERAVATLPDQGSLFNNLGNALCDAGRDDDAAERFRTAMSLQPEYAEACTNLGATLTRLGELDDARRVCAQATTWAPMLAEAHNNFGVALAAAGRFAEAMAAYQRAIELRPDYADAHSNLGVARCNAGQDAESALDACRRAVALQPGNAVLHTNLAMIALTLGRFEEGWREHEWRHAANPRIESRVLHQPRWRGEPLPGGTLLLHAEQGFGDTIQFARFVPIAAERVGRIIVEVQPELVALMRQSWPGEIRVIARGEMLPGFDVHCPLMSLPHVLGINDLPHIPGTPYLRAGRWRGELASGVKHLGLVWAGRPTHSNDRHRSLSLADFALMAKVPGVTFHSLQKGPAALQTLFPPPGLCVVDHDAELRDFTDTAALIAALDGVIAVDTAVAHLAGALGKPVWLLLPLVPDWRWQRDRADSPWYPSMRLVRQEIWNHWSGTVEKFLLGFGIAGRI